jgi:hypothetical protein
LLGESGSRDMPQNQGELLAILHSHHELRAYPYGD